MTEWWSPLSSHAWAKEVRAELHPFQQLRKTLFVRSAVPEQVLSLSPLWFLAGICRQEEIEAKLKRIESLIVSLDKKTVPGITFHEKCQDYR